MFYFGSREQKEIEFRHIANLDEVYVVRSVEPHAPRGVCQSPDDALLYVDTSRKPNNIRWVSPTSSGHLLVTKTSSAAKIQNVTLNYNEFLVVTCGVPDKTEGGVQVYNLKTNKLEWSVEGRLPGMDKAIKATGVTADDDGHIFVCDDNNECIQMFHVADGRYLGTLIQKGEKGLGNPCRIRWCNRISSFVIIHGKNGRWWISVYKAHMDPQVM